MKITTLFSKTLALAALLAILPALDATAATFTVTNTKDSGAGSLRQAITDANTAAGADTIVFDASFNTARTITLGGTVLLIGTNADLTITGPGANLLTVSGNNASRVFQIQAGIGQVTISGMTITQGSGLAGATANGGGIDNAGTTTLTNVIVTANTANFSGGGIYSTTSLTLNNCTVSNNRSSFNNTTSNNSNGGGIYINGGNLTATNSTISDNATGTVLTQYGGGIYINGASAAATLTNVILTGNTASFSGGGIYKNDGTLNITNSNISNNTSSTNDGGGIYSFFGTTMISGSIISGNQAAGSFSRRGGGIVLAGGQTTITNSIISDNQAVGDGGGVYYTSSQPTTFLSITGSTISNNTANSAVGNIGVGGGLYLEANNGAGNGGTGGTTITNSTISNNRALGANSSGTAGRGGGIYVGSSSTLNMVNSTVSGNFAGQDYGGIIWQNSSNEIFNLNITNSTIVNNTAASNVGGVGVTNASTTQLVNLRNTIVANNVANGGTAQDIGTSINSLGYNLIKNTTGATITGDTTTNITGQDPNLGPLQNNGGPTLTHALLAGSPAIDKGESADISIDQRGLPRPFDTPGIPSATGGDDSDIGAFEGQPPNTTPGSNVTVAAPEGDASVTFASISKEGFTTFNMIVPPSSAGLPPPGYVIVDDAPAYDITTTATFTPPITVCFTVDSITDEAEFARVRILHGEDGQLLDRTDLDSIDFAGRMVCATVDSLSPFVVALAPNPSALLNISTRMQVLTGDQVLIGGFIITGDDPKMVILRAIGPSLTDFGVAGALADPVLELRAIDGSVIQTNDNWTSDRAAIEATGLQPSNDLESAIVAKLDPGAYTAIVTGKNGGTGVGLVEAYDLDQAAASELDNISTRGFVDTGNNVMIGGFILGGEADVLIRALGPSLTDFGVTGALADPTVELHNAQGTLISSNDNWKEGGQQGDITATGLQPKKDKESALLETLSAGAYTAIVAGQGATTGVGLVEVYRLP